MYFGSNTINAITNRVTKVASHQSGEKVSIIAGG
jgi:hypothetical protein